MICVKERSEVWNCGFLRGVENMLTVKLQIRDRNTQAAVAWYDGLEPFTWETAMCCDDIFSTGFIYVMVIIYCRGSVLFYFREHVTKILSLSHAALSIGVWRLMIIYWLKHIQLIHMYQSLVLLKIWKGNCFYSDSSNSSSVGGCGNSPFWCFFWICLSKKCLSFLRFVLFITFLNVQYWWLIFFLLQIPLLFQTWVPKKQIYSVYFLWQIKIYDMKFSRCFKPKWAFLVE